ncbi:MAG: histone deacetylase family protein [Pseudomonadota bacterium]
MLLYTDDRFHAHETPAGHPERSDRLTAVERALKHAGLTDRLTRRAAPRVDPRWLEAAHSKEHIQRLAALLPDQGLVLLDPDTTLGPHSLDAAVHAAGALVDAVERVLAGEANRAFCAVRPPGHHAERGDAMGFCLFNSVAVAAFAALSDPAVERVAILDFDVHHGNGTVDIFRDDSRVLVCSSYQHPYYPNRHYDVEAPHLVHTPLVAGTDGAAFRQAIEASWLPAINGHQPDLILVSAGFDAHEADPLAQLNLTVYDFRWISELIADRAAEHSAGRIVSTLEGGYDLDALGACAAAHVDTLLATEPTP